MSDEKGEMPSAGSSVRVDRVVAVAATLRDGREQLGSGYLISGRLVLTAEHCTRDKATGEPAARLRVIRASDAAMADVAGVVPDRGLDVAVLQLADDAPWDTSLAPPLVARVDQSHSGVMHDCAGIGFALFQRDPDRRTRHTSEFHGTIYRTDERESGRLLMREPLIRPGPVTDPAGAALSHQDGTGASPWGGLSGALMFYRGRAIGVVVEHHPRQGPSALRAVGFDRIAGSAEIRECLGLPGPDGLPWVGGQAAVPLAELAEFIDQDELPMLTALDPYRLGATPSEFGDSRSYGQCDPYVPRTRDNVDARLRAALQPGRLVLVVGPSKGGKTRTAFEAAHQCWPQARLLTPEPAGLNRLVTHPRLASTADPVVAWLDDLQRFLTGTDPLTPALLARLLSRPGPTVVLATLRQEERARLRRTAGELTRDIRRLLDDARDTTVELGPTSDDPDEQAAARAAYPAADLSAAGLGEQLAGAPALLSQYYDARYSDPVLHAVVQTAVDWARVGMSRPIPGADLAALAVKALLSERPDLKPGKKKIKKSIAAARTPPTGAGRVAALRTVLLPDRSRGYRPFDYLVAADDGQASRPRAIPDRFWDQVLARANPDDAFAVGHVALQRENIPDAIHAAHQAAEAGHTDAMFTLGVLLSQRVDPPELEQARGWYQKAAEAGNTFAMFALGYLLADRVDPPELKQARGWYWMAAVSGNTDAMFALGVLLEDRVDPPELDQARGWYLTAAEAGNTGAMVNLGVLLADRVDPPELDQARGWYLTAAEAGNTGAMVNLGVLLADRVDPPELDQARGWYLTAAEAGNTDAMLNLGTLLAKRVDPPELDQARGWYQKAAEAGNTGAMLRLGVLLSSLLDPPELDQARGWYQKAAEAGDTDAMRGLGYLLSSLLDPPELDQARGWYQKAAEAGNTGAMFGLGNLLADRVDPPELDQARGWYQKAAEAGNTGAMFGLGNLLADRVDPPELDQARGWYRKAAEAGNTGAMFNLGYLLADRVDPPELDQARGWYRTAAEAGHTGAMFNLGVLLADRVDPPELDQARGWYRTAAEAGHTGAMFNLGVLLADRVDPPELDQARGWYRTAAEAGHTGAMLGLGVLLADRVDPPELDQARGWYRTAAEAGHTGAMYRLGVLLADRVDPPELDQARGWYRTAAEAGNTGAMYRLGVLLADRVDPPELDQARGWYQKAAEAGNTGAMLGLGLLLADRVDPPELDQARGWFQKAAEAGHTAGMLGLGYLLADRVDPPELDQARGWYQKAAEAGDTDAMFHLGVFLSGRVDPPEVEQARGWYQKAAEAGHTSAKYFMGALCAAQGDADGASRAWHKVIEEDQQDELVVAAALALAAVSALKADHPFARDLLELAGARGWTPAGTCTAAFDPNPLVRADARRRLQELADDTDALNFLGIASYIDGEYDETRSYWTRSSDLDDAVAPLLLHLTAEPQPPAGG